MHVRTYDFSSTEILLYLNIYTYITFTWLIQQFEMLNQELCLTDINMHASTLKAEIY